MIRFLTRFNLCSGSCRSIECVDRIWPWEKGSINLLLIFPLCILLRLLLPLPRCLLLALFGLVQLLLVSQSSEITEDFVLLKALDQILCIGPPVWLWLGRQRLRSVSSNLSVFSFTLILLSLWFLIQSIKNPYWEGNVWNPTRYAHLRNHETP